jgi:hypothetical protein
MLEHFSAMEKIELNKETAKLTKRVSKLTPKMVSKIG